MGKVRETIEVSGEWRHGKMSLAQFARRVAEFLQDFRSLHRELKSGFLLVERSLGPDVELPRDVEAAIPLISDRAWDRGAHDAYLPSDENEAPLPQSTQLMGYSVLCRRPVEDPDGWEWTFSIHSGAESLSAPNFVSIVIPPGDGRHSPEFLREALRTVIRHWWPDEACVSSTRFSMQLSPNRLTTKPVAMGIGWMTYTRRPGIHLVVPEGTQIEHFGEEQGKLIVLRGEWSSVDNDRQVAEAMRLRDTLRAAGMLDSMASTPPPSTMQTSATIRRPENGGGLSRLLRFRSTTCASHRP